MSARAARLRVEMKPLNDELKELREIAKPSDKEAARQIELIAELKSLQADYAKAKADYEQSLAVEAEYKSLDDEELEPRARYDRPLHGDNSAEASERIEGKSWFDIMTERKSFQRAVRDFAHIREQIPSTALYPFSETKTIPFAVTNPALSAPDVEVINQYTTNIRHPLLDLIPTTLTNQYHIDWLPLAFTNAAAETAWGATKPPSENNGTIQSVNMSTIAHTKSAIRQQLHYIPALRGEIEQEMREGVLARLEFQIINGAGTGVLLNGLLNQITQTATGLDLVAQIFDGIAIVEGFGGTVDAIVVNPTDVSKLIQYEWSNNQFNLIAGSNTFAGYRLVKTSAMPVGRALVGDWSMAVRLYIGDQLRVDSTEALQFNKNVIDFRGEIDAVVLARRPWLMVDCTGTIPVVGGTSAPKGKAA